MHRLPSLLLFAAALLGSCAEGRDRPAARDVVLIVIDSARADRFSCYGNPRETSPRIDELALESVRYERATAQAPWTTPSIGSLLTSRYPSALGIEDVQSALAEEWTLLPEALAAEGFRTGGVVSHSFCSSAWNFDQGFAWFNEDNIQGHDAVTSDGVTAQAIEFLRGVDEQPFFLFVHYFDPHFSYIEHEAYPFGGGDEYGGRVESGMLFKDLNRNKRVLTKEDVDEVLRLYDSEIAFTDRAIGELLDELRAMGRFADALIVLTGDHGEAFLDHGVMGHTRTLFDELVRVPLIVKYPGELAARGASRESVGLIDVYPTVLDCVGLKVPDGVEGRSLVEVERGARSVFTETSRRRRLRAVVRWPHKLVVDLNSGRERLYDLESDPEERRDLAEKEPSLVSELREEIEAWTARQEEVGRTAPTVDPSASERVRLEQLGYTEGKDEEEE